MFILLALGACGAGMGAISSSDATTAQPAALPAHTEAAAPAAAQPTPNPVAVQPADQLAASDSTTSRACAKLLASKAAADKPSVAQPVKRSAQSDRITFRPKDNTIVVGAGATARLADIAAAIRRPAALREEGAGIWLLNANLVVERDATLNVTAPDARWLKLRSDEGGFVSIRVMGGNLRFEDVCVTSWDEERGAVDHVDADGRSYVLARDGGSLKIYRSELSYLGYDANESYGVAWRLKDTRGAAVDSVFGYNFYGLYSYEVADLVIRGNEVHHSARYGIDPHTRSDRILIENNVAHHNGKQGIILAVKCSDGVVRNNVAHDNTLHGIVIYQGSNGNLVAGNTVFNNGLQGINVNDADNNTIRDNTVYANAEAGIGVGQNATGNQVVGNRVERNGEDGIFVFSDAISTSIEGNTVLNNQRHGIYIKSAGNHITVGNEVSGNTIGILTNTKQPPDIDTERNQIHGNREADIQHKGR